jgi:NADPH:quinone reductase-like Zn-dependent oxidoreductase
MRVRTVDPAPRQIRMRVRAAGVGPTDLAIRRGNLKEGFALAPDAAPGFEAAGVVDALGDGVDPRWRRPSACSANSASSSARRS